MNDSDETRILLDEIEASQRDIFASLSRVEDLVARMEIRLTQVADLAATVSQEADQIATMAEHRRRLLDSRRTT
ncbi:hypothetical protein LMG28727_02934 [Paraburkholderia kirstenboschensis]|uniref:hypothetical protein n=1 Tax=Paraburkholderia kirstenboschensis TaxID=1245436 RepID=UPI000A8AE0A8|nr:hypothetical protein [Paraburkholderia kirstenboschensis]CAD6532423.1 hypothetical protein LMG28727_02934 [Paraburkholderia kirstenboschensis]